MRGVGLCRRWAGVNIYYQSRFYIPHQNVIEAYKRFDRERMRKCCGGNVYKRIINNRFSSGAMLFLTNGVAAETILQG